ncbi:hypothetical protein ACP70R_036861 [Stipagrostis hirtigluma subsp. patula]
MATLERCLLVCVSLVILSVGCLPTRGSAMGGQLPQPPPNLNFTIAVEGAVWCKSCRYAGYDRSMGASPLPNAAVLLRCRHSEWELWVWNKTDANGHFLIQTGPQVSFASKDCKVYVPRSPALGCGVAVKPARKKGAPLKFRRFVPLATDQLQARYSAGNFTFAPEDPAKC